MYSLSFSCLLLCWLPLYAKSLIVRIFLTVHDVRFFLRAGRRWQKSQPSDPRLQAGQGGTAGAARGFVRREPSPQGGVARRTETMFLCRETALRLCLQPWGCWKRGLDVYRQSRTKWDFFLVWESCGLREWLVWSWGMDPGGLASHGYHAWPVRRTAMRNLSAIIALKRHSRWCFSWLDAIQSALGRWQRKGAYLFR